MTLAAALCCALTAPDVADACIPIPNATGLTDMQSRRAVIWLRADTFDMMFQNRYAGDAAGFAWVIPLPGVPTAVGQPSDNFFDDLDRFTSPMFEKRDCVVPCPSRNQWATDGGAALPGGTLPPDVTVWGSGKLGDLEYTVISATSAADLVAWLEPRGFDLPVELQPLIGDYLGKGFVFFAAKIAAGASTPASVPVVKFTFDRKTTPVTYPLRISAFNREQPLDTLLWIVAEDGTYRPKNYPTLAMDATAEHTAETYAPALEQAMSGSGGTTFAVQYASQPGGAAQSANDHNRQMLFYSYGVSSDEEMNALVFEFQHAPFVVRVRASLNPKGTNEDLTLEKTAAPLSVDGWYVSPCPGGITHEQCDTGPTPAPDGGPRADAAPPGTTPPPGQTTTDDNDDGGCALVPLPPAGAIAFAGLVLAALIATRRRRR